MQLMLQTTICDGLAFDPFAFEEDGLGPPKVDVSRSEIAQALVIAGMVVMSHEGRDLRDDESAGCDRHARPGIGGLRA